MAYRTYCSCQRLAQQTIALSLPLRGWICWPEAEHVLTRTVRTHVCMQTLVAAAVAGAAALCVTA